MLAEKIKSPADLRGLSDRETALLCDELREKIIDTVSINGGHLASNLGVVELTVAVHKVFNAPDDKIIFDVGHQSYVHKLLTGRFDGMSELRRKNGLSGFTRRSESEYDPFGSGHSGNAISAGLGFAEANKLNGKDDYVVCVVGDGSFTNGMVYEALNNCLHEDLNLIIILNDNEMSISRNVGGLSKYLSEKRSSKNYFRFKKGLQRFLRHIPYLGNGLIKLFRKIRDLFKRILLPGNIFEDLGLDYIGPVENSDVSKICDVLEEAKTKKKVCIVHFLTRKGLGYAPAEDNPSLYHAVAPFDKNIGVIPSDKKTFSSVFGEALVSLAKKDREICAVTAAMCDGTGLCGFANSFPERFFDVGIAEEHAVTFCAGLAAAGKKPVFAVYSSFLQRCFDQLIHDVAIQGRHVVVCVDRAGFVGGDGVTHQGLFDVGMALSVPGTKIWAPDGFDGLRDCLSKALESDGLCIVRYPKGGEEDYDRHSFTEYDGFSVLEPKAPPKATLVTYGRITKNAVDAAKNLGNVRVIKLIRLFPINLSALENLLVGNVFVSEEGMKNGGIGEFLTSSFPEKNITVRAVSDFTDGGSTEELVSEYGFDAVSLEKMISERNESV